MVKIFFQVNCLLFGMSIIAFLLTCPARILSYFEPPQCRRAAAVLICLICGHVIMVQISLFF
ncbi:hypothetical protein JHK82_049497 [Glycine max]|uniref:Uncharacterized protein n=2 Tax=Glycine subgen. Soja TaxID=1462606 RepID=A0A0R0EWK8_SOYBN|nr:hypothetical protein JHK86_049355 [Glycine max]KAG4923612.1 hypothetical protein JHK87_049152 [Glycine soja]KAG4935200.1 hypothetical protein JHK85_050119 [Glycine max]KAG5090719.1 hypothetical protein JHK82_049497 [Glycine max]KAG5093806.1 hypothetical protein JHK84_049394 [Glycine max]